MSGELQAQLFVQKQVIMRLIYRLREVSDFQMMGLVQDLSQLEAQMGSSDLPDEAIELIEQEFQDFIELVQEARGVAAPK